MNYFFVFLLQSVLPIALLLGISSVICTHTSGKKQVWLALFGFIAGLLMRLSLPSNQVITLTLTSINLGILLFFFLAQFTSSLTINRLFYFLLSFVAGNLWAKDPNIRAVTNTDIINTDFLLHLSAIILGIIFCIILGGWLALVLRQFRVQQKIFEQNAAERFERCQSNGPVRGEKSCQGFQVKRTALYWLLLSGITLLLAIPVFAEGLLSLMKLQVLELTKLRLSFVAKAGNIPLYFNYLSGLIVTLVIVYFIGKVHRPRRHQVQQTSEPIAKRQAMACALTSHRLILWGAIAVGIIVTAQLYWDKIASQPPQLSEAQPVTLDAHNEIHIPIEKVKDGKLHRFLWVADDGKAVRFFIINRTPEKLNLAAVFDACILCGDQGYVMEGNQVICVGCDVHLFIPSIGKAGGCNPVPIENWVQNDHEVIINKKSLEEGLNYFTTIIEIEVIDPVDGSKLTNTKTEYRYEYASKTYFFANETNFNAFRENPENYLKGKN